VIGRCLAYVRVDLLLLTNLHGVRWFRLFTRLGCDSSLRLVLEHERPSRRTPPSWLAVNAATRSIKSVNQHDVIAGKIRNLRLGAVKLTTHAMLALRVTKLMGDPDARLSLLNLILRRLLLT
jgi:hypothetical protein